MAISKNDLVDKLLKKRGISVPEVQTIARRPEGAPTPVSAAQQRFYHFDQLNPGSSTFNLPGAIRMKGALDVASLGKAWNEMIRRHEALRTTFASVGGEPQQVIGAPFELDMPVLEAPGLAEEARVAAATKAGGELALEPFDLAKGPLVRARLVRFDAADHALLFSIHHIISDLWSLGVLMQELIALYEAFSAGKPSPLPELAIQFADHAAWHREHLAGGALEKQLGYWKEQLAGAPPTLDLPTDRPRPPVQTFAGARRHFRIPAEAARAAGELARKEGATMYMTLLAAFDVLLSAYAGTDDIVVGSPLANRNARGTDALIGCFANMIVTRTNLEGASTFRDVLARVKETILGAFDHGDVPFETLVDAFSGTRDPSRPPLFQVVFIVQPPTVSKGGASGLALDAIDIDAQNAKFDYVFMLTEEADGIRGTCELATDLFDEATADRFARHFVAIVERLAAEADQPVATLRRLPDDDLRRVLGWSAPSATFPENGTLVERFEAQAGRTPDAPALSYEKTTLTYGELDRQANQLAHALRAKGVKPNDLVALCLDRTHRIVIGILGVLKAGGAYLPLDADYPVERLEFMLGDASPAVLVTESAVESSLPDHDATVVHLDDDADEIAAMSDARPDRAATPQDLAYVIYTSGSTGKPKGALVTHHNVVRLFDATDAWFHFSPSDTWSFFHSYAFDFSVWEIWGALLYGGRVIVVPYWMARAPDAFRKLLIDEKVTVLSQTPSAFRQIVQIEETAEKAAYSLRTVVFGGEALDLEDLRPWFDRHGDQQPQLVNMYGITETTVHVTYRPIGVADLAQSWASVIGRPIPDLGVYILGRDRQPAPIGVTGELYVAGAGVARGYLNRDELTAERFIANPFSDKGDRLYKTGDLGRFRPDGDIDHQGRIDHQVKLRGFRIELGEIETALEEHPGVRKAIVIARDRGPGDRYLAAYVQPVDMPGPTREELDELLRESLPDYMVPSAFVTLADFPLTGNGKIDRANLPDPEVGTDDDRPYVAPRGQVEEVLAGIWQEVLSLERVGSTDNFFDHGGHSLLAIRVTTRASKALGVEIPVRSVFDAPTIAGMAKIVSEARQSGSVPPLVRVPREGHLPLSFGQEQLWFLAQLDPTSPFYNIPLGLRIDGPLDVALLEKSIGEVVRRHEILRTTYGSVEGKPVAVVHAEMPVAMPIIDCSGETEAEQEESLRREGAAELSRPFDLTKGPVLRTKVVRLGPQRHVLLAMMHHIAVDAWTTQILVEEVGAVYQALEKDEPNPLPELAIQYVDYAAWQRSWLSGETMARELDHWVEALKGAPTTLEVPTDRPRPPVQSFRGSHATRRIDPKLSDATYAFCRSEGVTPYMVALAVFNVLLWRYTGQDDILVGTSRADRRHRETEPLIGYFLSQLVLRAKLSGDPSFKELLARLRDTTLSAYAHQDVPFDRIVEALRPERDLSRSPIFQVMVDNPQAAHFPQVGDLTITGLGASIQTSRFDLTFALTDRAGLVATLEYSTELFDHATIERMLGHFETLLSVAIATPDMSIADMEMMTDAEQQQLEGWSAT